MEFITAEQFKEQPKEVQKVFLDWWEPSVGDIFIFTTDELDNSDSNIGVLSSNKQIKITNTNKGEYRTPLFTEGQLRKFIEDKTGTKVESSLTVYKQYALWLVKVKGEDYNSFDTREEDLLQAYWKVACIIAKEKVDE